MRWTRKSAMFRLLSSVPYGASLHHLAQRHVTREWPRPEAYLDSYRERARTILDAARTHGIGDLSQCTFVEIGAGRDLALAIALRIAGVGRVICIDIERLAKLDLVQHAATYLGAGQTFRSWQELEAFGVTYQAPSSAETTGIADGTIDCFYTSEVLEHIPQESLARIFEEAHRYLKPNGLSIHAIDYSDHYARSDPSISRYNFLTFSEEDWRPHNSAFQYVNRLRHSSYLALMESAKLRIVDAEVEYGELPTEVADRLSPLFRGMDRQDLSALRSIVVAING